MHRRALALAAVAAVATLAPVHDATAQRDPRITRSTGQDTRVWPPDVLFDYDHMRLEMVFADMGKASFEAVQTLTATPIGSARDEITLDAGRRLEIESVTLDGQALAFDHDRDHLTITLPRAFNPGEVIELVTTYRTDDPGGGGAGLTWSDDDSRTPEVDPMFHAQGQPESNHLWFPCHDFPNERASVELIVTVPAGFEAVSNGALERITRTAETSTYHWLQRLPHPFYLTTLVIGKFDVINLGGPDSARPGMWMPVYGPIGSAGVLKRNFAVTAEMLAMLESKLAEPYPWDKYANLICRDFSAGAMENTGTVTWNTFAVGAPASFVDPINMHEMIHHWFGDLITCRTWEHLWLNEGWAAYGEALWAEHKGGPDAYLDVILSNAMGRSGQMYNHVPAPRETAMASNRYRNPDQRFMSRNNVYAKGPIILHMLRRHIGDAAFWDGVHAYIDKHKFDQVETADFRMVMEEASGVDLELFFSQWVYRPMTPRLDVEFEYSDGQLEVTMEQRQRVDELNPAFVFDLPVRLELADGSTRDIKLRADQRINKHSVQLDDEPVQASVNPDFDVLVRTDVTKPLAWWIDELADPATSYARMQAEEHLRTLDDPRAREALAELAPNTDAPAASAN